jgi:hypothetical protein
MNRNLVSQFRSPYGERSIVKGIPLILLEEVKVELKEIFPFRSFRIKYRGPRQSVGSDSKTCWKRFATSAAIYERTR